jgi:lysophospholipase L1-like esterase
MISRRCRKMAGIANSYLPVCAPGPIQEGSGQATFGLNFNLERHFTGVKLILANHWGSEQVIAGVCCAPSASLEDGVTPVDKNGDHLPWTPVTFDGSNAVILPGSRPSDGGVTYKISDLVPIESSTRMDGSPFCALMTRALSSMWGYRVPTISDAQVAAINTLDGGRLCRGYVFNGDGVSDLEKQGSLSRFNVQRGTAFPCIAGVVFYAHERCLSYGFFGDSLTQGLGTKGDLGGYGRRVSAALSGPACGVSMVDGSVSGQTIAQIVARLRALLAIGATPHIVSLPIDSPNDYALDPSAKHRVCQETTVFQVAEDLMKLRSIPVLIGSLPFGPGGLDPHNEQRVISAGKIRRITQQGVLTFDAPSAICGYTPSLEQPAVVPADYLSFDGFHYNDRLQQLLADRLRPVLFRALAC